MRMCMRILTYACQETVNYFNYWKISHTNSYSNSVKINIKRTALFTHRVFFISVFIWSLLFSLIKALEGIVSLARGKRRLGRLEENIFVNKTKWKECWNENVGAKWKEKRKENDAIQIARMFPPITLGCKFVEWLSQIHK